MALWASTLKEIVIDENTQISAENLVLSLWTKVFTWSAIIYGTLRSLDPALNWLQDEKQCWKKEVIVEYKEQMLIKLDYLFYRNITLKH
jgi:hypothetical protein